MTRPNFDKYFMNIAREVAARATCPRRQVGAIIVQQGYILATGYNGSMKGAEHCIDIGCLMENGHCVRTVHAEANAITQAAQHGVSTKGATIYTTASPCWNCFKLIVNAGIVGVKYADVYLDGLTSLTAHKMGFPMELVK